jgi:isopenicillin N synthase-like dioxygenase
VPRLLLAATNTCSAGCLAGHSGKEFTGFGGQGLPRTIDLKQSDRVHGTVADSVLCISADELLNSNEDDLVDVVRSACIEPGFFFVDLSSSQQESLSTALVQMERFFSLPDDDPRKQDVRQDDTADTGWVPKFTEPAYQPDTVSSLEAYDFDIENVARSDDDRWPRLSNFRIDLTACWDDWTKLGDYILRLIARAANMPADFLSEHCNSQALSTMRLLHYGPEKISTDRNVGISAHTDFECITLLYQTAPGLELLDVKGSWLDAPVRDGCIVVLLDDMLEHWTNGLFRATGHRVRNTEELRFSIVKFVAANGDIEIAPLPQFVTAESPQRYPPISQEEHIDNEIQRAKGNSRLKPVPQ